jgi:hypothetical protein
VETSSKSAAASRAEMLRDSGRQHLDAESVPDELFADALRWVFSRSFRGYRLSLMTPTGSNRPSNGSQDHVCKQWSGYRCRTRDVLLAARIRGPDKLGTLGPEERRGDLELSSCSISFRAANRARSSTCYGGSFTRAMEEILLAAAILSFTTAVLAFVRIRRQAFVPTGPGDSQNLAHWAEFSGGLCSRVNVYCFELAVELLGDIALLGGSIRERGVASAPKWDMRLVASRLTVHV